MGTKICLVILVAAVATGLYFGSYFCADPTPPKIENGWWGRGPKKDDRDKTIRKFKVDIKDHVLVDLKSRLSLARLGEDIADTKFHYGFRVDFMKEIISYWQNTYDWRKQETLLNSYPHFKTIIEGIDVHFIRVLPKTGQTTRPPLILIHGWPGTIWSFYNIIPLLVDPAKYGGREEDALEIICPSIPGYGFSEAPHRQGFDVTDAARVFYKLMSRLGHDKFYVHGDDWGAIIGSSMGQAYPKNVLALHVTVSLPPMRLSVIVKAIVGSVFPQLLGITEEEYRRFYPLSKTIGYLLEEFGYFHLQTTKPDTAAFGLNDSPVGLAAYILEKYSTWTNPGYRNLSDGGLTAKFTFDELLNTVMIYWVNNNIGPSMRFYKEYLPSQDVQDWDLIPVDVPTGLSNAPYEVLCIPQAIAAERFRNIVQFTVLPRGGHFSAQEEPELLAQDIQNLIRKVKRDSAK